MPDQEPVGGAEIAVRPIVITGVVIVATVASVVLAVGGLRQIWQGPAGAVVSSQNLPPAPRLQSHAPRDLAALRAEKETALHSYGWVDRAAGIVHIPIEQAMALAATRAAAAPTER